MTRRPLPGEGRIASVPGRNEQKRIRESERKGLQEGNSDIIVGEAFDRLSETEQRAEVLKMEGKINQIVASGDNNRWPLAGATRGGSRFRSVDAENLTAVVEFGDDGSMVKIHGIWIPDFVKPGVVRWAGKESEGGYSLTDWHSVRLSHETRTEEKW